MDSQKLKDKVRALEWWARHLGIPLKNGELVLFDKIIDDMKNLIMEDEK